MKGYEIEDLNKNENEYGIFFKSKSIDIISTYKKPKQNK